MALTSHSIRLILVLVVGGVLALGSRPAQSATIVLTSFESHSFDAEDAGIFGYNASSSGGTVTEDAGSSLAIHLFDLSAVSQTTLSASLGLHVTSVGGSDVEGPSPPPYFRTLRAFQSRAVQADLQTSLNLVEAHDFLAPLFLPLHGYGVSGSIGYTQQFPDQDVVIPLDQGDALLDITTKNGGVFILAIGISLGADGDSVSFSPPLTTLTIEVPEPSIAWLLLVAAGLASLRARSR